VIPGTCNDYDDAGDEINVSNAIPTDSWWWQATTELERFELGPSNIHGYKRDDGDNANENEEEEASQADDGLTQTLEDWAHTTRECEDWTVYFRPLKYDNCKANATASDVFEAKTVL